ncbi:hypothetical protein B0H11DRAFT_1917415 [Mycena galericulata]|nr:hypothetical protein B0H11DRAFT_1917415 [Mycena galericulata]
MAEQINFNATIGPEEVGVIVGAWMFGMFTLQVAVLWYLLLAFRFNSSLSKPYNRVLELVHVILSCVGLYGTTVTHFGDGPNVLFINKAIGLSLIISATVSQGWSKDSNSFTVKETKVFFADRVRILSGHLLVPLFCVCVATLVTPFIPEFKAKWDWLLLSSIPISTSVDVVVAISLCTLLWQRHTVIRPLTPCWPGLLTSAAFIMMLIFVDDVIGHPSPICQLNASFYPTAIAIEMSHTREVVQDNPSSDMLDTKRDLEDQSQAM